MIQIAYNVLGSRDLGRSQGQLIAKQLLLRHRSLLLHWLYVCSSIVDLGAWKGVDVEYHYGHPELADAAGWEFLGAGISTSDLDLQRGS